MIIFVTYITCTSVFGQIQEESNKAAALFDKASSQYAAAKEMIRLTEEELANQLAPQTTSTDRDANHALLEVLNHATIKVSADSSIYLLLAIILVCCRL